MVTLDEEPEDELWCMALTMDCGPMTEDVVILDGGSDAHVAPPAFCGTVPLEASTSKLCDVQSGRLAVQGACKVPMVLENKIAAVSRFEVGNVTRALWSVGLLFDAGYDVIISKHYGTYLSKGGDENSRVPLTRVKNCFGVAVKTFGASAEAQRVAKSHVTHVGAVPEGEALPSSRSVGGRAHA